MGIRIVQVDAFTSRPFAGNPAAVCLLPGPRPDDWLQHVAREMNLSETAFLLPEDDGFRLRWFTPVVEVDLCGHATLASAHILWEEGRLDPAREAIFYSRSGRLTATRQGDAIELDFPASAPQPAGAAPELARALGVEPLYVGRSKFDYLVLVESAQVVRGLHPDFAALRQAPVRGVIVTAAADEPDVDFVSRFFAPAVGVDEDPVTGSAHCCLGPFWQERLGKSEFNALQVSARGGALRVRVAGERVLLGGRAVTVLRGELAV